MKRNMYRLLLLSVLIMMVMFVQAQNEYGIVLEESFEEGIPEDWTQEYTSGTHDWVVESGDLSRPNDAYKGKGRLVFRNDTTTSKGYVTKFVSPVMDLSKLFNPILKFAYAQDQWTSDFDTLRVYYRSDTTRPWSPLKTYRSYMPKWQYETLSIIGKSSTYQIAFEGTDNMGRGIVLDDIMVRSTPNCIQPYNIRITDVTNNTASLRWSGNYDAEKFLIKIHSSSISVEDLDLTEADAFDGELTTKILFKELTSLNPGKAHYVYIKAVCSNESSSWSEEVTFNTNNITSVPYVENFNKDLNKDPNADYVTRLNNWTYGTSEGNAAPYINVNSRLMELGNWSRDASTALMFTGFEQSHKVLVPKGYIYCATPEMIVDSISKLQVSFWGRYSENKASYYRLIVGVMTDPSEIASFVAIDTVQITKIKEFQEFIIPLSSYEGNGKYIGLLAQFDHGTNQFFLDDFKVEATPICAKARDVKIVQKSATEATISWYSGAVSSGDIILADTIINPDSIGTREVITINDVTNPYTITGLNPWTKYYIYIRNVRGEEEGEWSNVRSFHTPEAIAVLPHIFDFEIDRNDPSSFHNPTTNIDNRLPLGILAVYNERLSAGCRASSERSEWDLSVFVAGGYTYLIFPELPNIKNTTVEFLARGNALHSSGFEVGIIENINDISSFSVIKSLEAEVDNKYFRVDLDKYKGDGKFFAIRVLYDYVKNEASQVFFDNLLFDEIPTCKDPVNIKVEPKDVSVNISWDDDEVSSWEVRLSLDELMYDSINSTTYKDYVSIDTVDTPNASFINLVPSETKYFYSIRALCGDEIGSWTVPGYFVTECLYKNPLPYELDFEGYSAAISAEFAVPCLFTEVEYANPKITTDGYKGRKVLYMDGTTKYSSYNYMALPKMDIDSVNKLQISMMLKTTKIESELHVGVMVDPNNRSTFDSLFTIHLSDTHTYEEFILPFTKYKGDGEHIAFRMAEGKDGSFSINDIKVDGKSPCAKVKKTSVVSVTDTSAVLSWTLGDDEKKWNLVVSTSGSLSEENRNKALLGTYVEGITYAGIADSVPFVVKNLIADTDYYFYVQARCSDTQVGDWGSNVGSFRTECGILDVEKLGVEDFDTYGTGYGKFSPCWKVGNMGNPPSYKKVVIPYCDAAYKHSGIASLKFNSTTTYNGSYAISSLIDIDSIKNLQVSFWGSCTGKYTQDKYQRQLVVGILTSSYDLSTFMPIDTIDGYADEQYYTIPFNNYKSDYDGDKGKYVMFLSEFDKENYFWIDDVRFDTIPECQYPDGIKIDALTHDSIAISWANGSAPYNVKIASRQLLDNELNASQNPEDGSVVAAMNTTEAKVQYKGLSPNTQYYMYAASNCGDVKTWSTVIRFTTECPPSYPLSYIEDFNSYTQTGTGINPDCWISYYAEEGKENDYPQIHKTGRTGAGLYVYSAFNKQSYAVTPRLEVDDISECQVTFWGKPSHPTLQRNIIVGVASDVSTNSAIVSTFVAIDTFIVKSATYDKYVVPFSKYATKGKHVVFSTAYDFNLSARGKTSGGMFIDDIEIEIIPTCPKPEGMVVNEISFNYCNLSIEGGPDTDLWDVKYVKRGSNLELRKDTTVNNRNFNLLSLTPNTNYDVYVRAVCAANDKSVWFGAISVATLEATPVESYPYIQNFENEDENSNWVFLNGQEVNKWHIGNGHKKDGQKALYISKDDGVTADYDIVSESYSWAIRPVKLTKGLYTFNFDWTCFGESANDFMRFGLLPSTSKFAAGSPDIIKNDGSKKAMATSSSGTPSQWLPLEGVNKDGTQRYKMNLVDTTKLLTEQWVSNSVSHIINAEAEGVYYLVIYWKNNGGGGLRPNPSAVIDNISISHSNCVKPVEFKTDVLLDTTATISWTNVGDGATAWEVFVTADAALNSPDEVSGANFQVTNIASAELKDLADKTMYYVFVRSVCGDSKYSAWSDRHEFKTICSPYNVGDKFGFEEIEGHYVFYNDYPGMEYNTAYKAPECFEIGNIKDLVIEDNYWYFPNAEKNSSEYEEIYSHTGDYSLKISNTSSGNKGSYIAFPQIDEDMDSLQISFWIRPISHNISGQIERTSTAASSYAKSINIGTMESTGDYDSYVEIAEVIYPYDDKYLAGKKITDDPSGNEFWIKYTVPITTKSGRHVVLMNNSATIDKNLLYIDDVTIEKISSCVAPYSLEVSNVTDRSADITFSHTGGESWDLILSDNEDFTDTIFRDTITVNQYTIENLKSGSNYYFKVQQQCEGNEISNWSAVSPITTSKALRIIEDFNSKLRVPEDWTRAAGRVEQIFGGKGLAYREDTYPFAWNRSAAHIFTDGHQMMNFTSVKDYWLLSPIVSIRAEMNAHITFDLALTEKDSPHPPSRTDLVDDEGQAYEDNMFMLIISEDGGLTWKKENATIWDNLGTGNRSFNSISNTGDHIDIDLSKYANKSIKIAFHGQSLEDNTSVDLHIDNININYVSIQDLTGNLCQTEDYDLNGFDIRSKEITDEVNTFDRSVLAATDVPDTVYSLTINVKPMVEYPIEATLCEGEIYDKYDFSTSKLGHHQHKLKADNGCDSVVKLNLSLIPIVETKVEDTICQGGNYAFNDSVYSRTGVYTHTIKSKVTFCDSIVTLILTVREAITTKFYKVVCYGDSIDFGKHKNIRTSGVYVDTFQTKITECDSIVTLTVKAYTEKIDTVLNEIICAGAIYSENGFKGVSETGTYHLTNLETDDDCDSLVTLNLVVLSGDTSEVKQTITTKDLPYTYVDDQGNEGKTFDVGTKPGVYKDTITVSTGECEGVIILTLTIELDVSVDNIDYTPFSITPNPIVVGESVNVEIAKDINVVTCEVYDATGALITSFSPKSNPIILNDFNIRGIYMIRVTTDTSKVFVGKVLVK